MQNWQRVIKDPMHLAKQLLAIVLVPLAVALCLLPIRGIVTTTDVAMLQLLWVTWVAHRSGKKTAIATTLVSVGLFDWFHVKPYYTLHVHNIEYLTTFLVMLALGLFISQLSGLLRNQLQRAKQLMRQIRGMFALARGINQRDSFYEQVQFVTRLLSQRLKQPVCWQTTPEHNAEQTQLPVYRGPQLIGALQIATTCYNSNRTLLHTAISLLEQVSERQWLTEQNRQATVKAELERDRALMLRSISHDLRTPLATIMGASSMLADDSLNLSNSEIRQQAQNIYQQSHLLNSHFQKVMELSRVQLLNHPLQIQQVGLSELVAGASARRAALLTEQTIDVTDLNQLACAVDITLMEIALANVFENAVSHGAGAIQVQLTQQANHCCLTVSNAIHRQRSNQRDSGTGLGLPICHLVMQLHGGEFQLQIDQQQAQCCSRFYWPQAQDSHA